VFDSEPELAELESTEDLLQEQAAALARSGQSLEELPSKKRAEELQVSISNSLEVL
jgi:hypothetical protein